MPGASLPGNEAPLRRSPRPPEVALKRLQDVLTAARLREVYGIEAYLGEEGGSLVVHPLDLAE